MVIIYRREIAAVIPAIGTSICVVLIRIIHDRVQLIAQDLNNCSTLCMAAVEELQGNKYYVGKTNCILENSNQVQVPMDSVL